MAKEVLESPIRRGPGVYFMRRLDAPQGYIIEKSFMGGWNVSYSVYESPQFFVEKFATKKECIDYAIKIEKKRLRGLKTKKKKRKHG